MQYVQEQLFYRKTVVTVSELESNISNTNFDRNKKKLFLYFDTSHGNQTNKKCFHILLKLRKSKKDL